MVKFGCESFSIACYIINCYHFQNVLLFNLETGATRINKNIIYTAIVCLIARKQYYTVYTIAGGRMNNRRTCIKTEYVAIKKCGACIVCPTQFYFYLFKVRSNPNLF